MNDIVFQHRIIENSDWAIILFVISFGTIAITKSAFENRFSEFVNLIYSNKYWNIYKEGSNLKSVFTIALFFVQIITFAFFIQISLSHFEYASKADLMQFVQIVTFILYFVLSKFLMEKIIANAFDIEEFVEQFNLHKVIFRSYIGLFLLPICLILYFNYDLLANLIPVLIYCVLAVNLFTYITLIKNNQNIIFSKLFYFILYLCTLEIAPYYFIYHWFTKGIA